MMRSKNYNTNLVWLFVGAFIGLIFAGYGIFTEINSDQLEGSEVAAVVNEAKISKETYLQALDRFNTDTKDELSTIDREWVLQRLIEEELLVQRGLALGILDTDNDVRGAIVRALIASINNEVAAIQPSDDELVEYYNSHQERFTYPGAIAVKVWITATENDALSIKIAIQENKVIPEKKNTRLLKNIPQGLLTMNKLREYIGPTLVTLVASNPEQKTVVNFSQGRWYVVEIVQRKESITQPFNEIKYQVINEYMRYRADEQLRQYINNLKESATIKLNKINDD